MPTQNVIAPTEASDLYGTTVQTMLDMSVLAYDSIAPGNSTLLLNSKGQIDPLLVDLVGSGGWNVVPLNLSGGQEVQNSYQGIAFYKEIAGVTDIVIANRGSQSIYDFAVSDLQLSLNIVPAADIDAFNYF
jgi:hypothetical protein